MNNQSSMVPSNQQLVSNVLFCCLWSISLQWKRQTKSLFPLVNYQFSMVPSNKRLVSIGCGAFMNYWSLMLPPNQQPVSTGLLCYWVVVLWWTFRPQYYHPINSLVSLGCCAAGELSVLDGTIQQTACFHWDEMLLVNYQSCMLQPIGNKLVCFHGSSLG